MRRQTKQQREAARLASVLQRVEDIYAGAMGEPSCDPDDWSPDLAAVGRIMQAVRSRFGVEADCYIFRPWYLEKFQTPAGLAKAIVALDLDLPRKEPTNG